MEILKDYFREQWLKDKGVTQSHLLGLAEMFRFFPKNSDIFLKTSVSLELSYCL